MTDQTMRLKAIYFNESSETGLPYIKAMVYVQDVPYFETFGATLYPPEIEEEIYKEEVSEPEEDDAYAYVEGDKGTGKPGTIEWYEAGLREIRSKEEIKKFMEDVLGKKITIDRRKNLKFLKQKALDTIKEHLNNDG